MTTATWRLWGASIACVLLFTAAAQGEEVRLCDQRVQYTPVGASPDIQGVWLGRLTFSALYFVCLGLAVEGPDGPKTSAVIVWNSSTSGNDMRNVAALGIRSVKMTRQPDASYTIGNYRLRREGNRLVGKYRDPNSGGDYDVSLTQVSSR